MNKTNPTRPAKAKAKPLPKAAEPAPKPLASNKYAPKQKVGTPQLRRPNRVSTVGLGGLEVVTAEGIKE
jgi:hypothetical protein